MTPAKIRADGKGEDGGRLDAGKIRVELLPFDAMIEVAKVLTCGAEKYSPRNWEKGMAWSRVVGSMLRHIFARMGGEIYDPETGLSHSSHIACNALFLVSYELRKVGDDDLPK